MTKSNFNKIRAAIAITVLATSTLCAGTFQVRNTADSGPGSLRQAILSANARGGGDIKFHKVSGTITLQSSLPAIARNIRILGPDKSALTISGNGQFSVFSINAGVVVLLRDLTIADGSATGSLSAPPMLARASGVANAGEFEICNCVISNCMSFFSDGGAIYNSGNLQMTGCLVTGSGSSGPIAEVDGGAVFNSGRLSMRDCVISNCLATEGGGIYNSGNALLRGCSILGCYNDYGEGDGGGVYNSAGAFALRDCVISNCQAGFDGGGAVSYGELTMRDTTITSNSAFEGGGLYLGGGTNALHNSTINRNLSYEYGGGGIKNLDYLTLTGCTVSGNSSLFDGGGGIENLKVLVMTNCTVSGNSCSRGEGAGLLNTTNDDEDGEIFSGTLLQITDCTIASNNAAGSNGIGGIDNNGGEVQLRASILADNMSADYSGLLDSQGYNLIEDTNGATLGGNFTGNLYGADPLLGPLQDNGGRTFTHALLPGSPAIASGPVGGPPYFDQRGVPRPQNSADDIGAFQSKACHIHLLTLTHSRDGFQIALKGTPGLNYSIQRASSPNGPWTTFTNITAGSDGSAACMETWPPAGGAFYRSVFP